MDGTGQRSGSHGHHHKLPATPIFYVCRHRFISRHGFYRFSHQQSSLLSRSAGVSWEYPKRHGSFALWAEQECNHCCGRCCTRCIRRALEQETFGQLNASNAIRCSPDPAPTQAKSDYFHCLSSPKKLLFCVFSNLSCFIPTRFSTFHQISTFFSPFWLNWKFVLPNNIRSEITWNGSFSTPKPNRNMNHQSEFQIKTRKQLLDEQILQEKGKFQFGILWAKETDELLSRSLARMRCSGWILRGIETHGFIIPIHRYVFEQSLLNEWFRNKNWDRQIRKDESVDLILVPSGLLSHILLGQAVRQKQVVAGDRRRSAEEYISAWHLLGYR